jgi:hypothetical protein
MRLPRSGGEVSGEVCLVARDEVDAALLAVEEMGHGLHVIFRAAQAEHAHPFVVERVVKRVAQLGGVLQVVGHCQPPFGRFLFDGSTARASAPPGVEREISTSSSVIVLRHALEERRRQVALAGVGQHAQDHRAGARPSRRFHRHGEGGAAGDAGEDALLGASSLAHLTPSAPATGISSS